MDKTGEASSIERAVERMSGRFKLTVLIQKRVRELQQMGFNIDKPDMRKLIEKAIEDAHEERIDLVTEEEFRESLRAQIAKEQEKREAQKAKAEKEIKKKKTGGKK